MITSLPLPSAPALGSGGGTSTTTSKDCDDKARLRDGKAIPPDCAPRRVKQVIRAGNDIAKGKGYCLGGGHGSWHDNCYDCSGAVSYALHGGDFVKSPMPSGSYMHWAKKGKGHWFTVYANSGHMFLKIAGLRFDTSDTPGAGPGWAKGMGWEKGQDYRKRHKKGY